MASKTEVQSTVLGYCLAAAAAELVEPGTERLSAIARAKIMARSTPKGVRVASFIVEWALMQRELERDDLSVEDYITWSHVPRRTCYHRAAEFRSLWPDQDLNALAIAVRDAATRGGDEISPSVELAL